ncbi:hypothetical protein D8M05_14015 [Oceanobacillus bengalensis]|uniref:Membrane protein YizD n=1 Tax=Oceanobacillus bengalensis TaxID=1435466 RepID=A0A494YVI3_9BACI|nr:hypothetical protein D8M05_14015 [Oceanobacillus bengalensis]
MQQIYPILFLILLISAFFLNILGLMQLIPLFFTLPLLFISIYLTIYSFRNPKNYRRRMR